MPKPLYLIFLPLILLFSACEADVKTGSMVIHLYSQSLQDNLDNDEYPNFDTMIDTLQIDLYSLIQIEGLTPEYYMGDKYGRITVSDVPVGTYTVHPLFMDSQNDIPVVVSESEQSKATILMPANGMGGVILNADFEAKEIRQALAIGINRVELTETWVAEPSYTIFPQVYYTDGLFTSDSITEDPVLAAELMAGKSLTFTYLYNNSANNDVQVLADYLKSKWESFAAIDTVTLEKLDWTTFLDVTNNQKNFEVARLSWSFDSNNPYAFVKHILDSSDYSSDTANQWKNELESAIASGNMEAFLDYLDKFHTLLLEEGLFFPVYELVF